MRYLPIPWSNAQSKLTTPFLPRFLPSFVYPLATDNSYRMPTELAIKQNVKPRSSYHNNHDNR